MPEPAAADADAEPRVRGAVPDSEPKAAAAGRRGGHVAEMIAALQAGKAGPVPSGPPKSNGSLAATPAKPAAPASPRTPPPDEGAREPIQPAGKRPLARALNVPVDLAGSLPGAPAGASPNLASGPQVGGVSSSGWTGRRSPADASARVSHLLKSLLFVMSSAQGSPASHALSSEAAAHLAGFLDHFDEGLPRLALALGDLHLRSNGNDRTFLRAQNCFRSILGVRDELQSLAVLCGAGKQSAPCQGRGQ